MVSSIAVLGFIASFGQALQTTAPYFRNDTRPNIVCHRGTAGRFPEHSLGGQDDCFFQNVEMIELDIHPTKDGHLIVNHEPTMDSTTNIAEYDWLFSDRRASHEFPRYYKNFTDEYFFHDFDLAEIKMVTRKQRYHFRSAAVNSVYQVLTVREAIENLLMLN
jgi:glycerophosphoryl diester phosphodiesterase